MAISIAPLSLPGIAYACYDLEVRNDLEQPVWSVGDPGQSQAAGDTLAVCSNQYGAGGSIAYVGPCDASENDAGDGGQALNTVTIRVDGLYNSGGADIGGWQDPCPSGCTLAASCVENQDTAVSFDLSIAREANQGFFDVAVSLADVFCSAKLDCVDALLHDNGTRGPTAVLAVACTSGVGNTPTYVYLDNLAVSCDGGEAYTIVPLGAGGTLGAQEPGLFDTTVYHGGEQLSGVEKCFWNVGLGLDLVAGGDGDQLGDNCRLTTHATASRDPLTDAGGEFRTPGSSVHPLIAFDVPLTGASGAIACSQHPLNGGNGVATVYTDIADATGFGFANEMRCGAQPRAATPALQLAGIAPSAGGNTGGTAVTITGSRLVAGAGASVTIGGAACTGASWTTSTITCTTPAGSNGPQDVVVTNDGGASATLIGGFTYGEPESWRATSTVNAPNARSSHASVWVGDRMLIVGGTVDGNISSLDVGLYDPVTDSWSAGAAAPYSSFSQSLVWTGTEAILWGGVKIGGSL